MKNTKIKLNSRYLKVGDKIIRTKSLNLGNSLFVSCHGTVAAKNSTHIKLVTGVNSEWILAIDEWNDGNWVRYTL